MKVKGLKKILIAITLGASVCAGATVAVIGTQAPTVEAAPVNQWKNVKGKWYFYKNGKKTTGWKYLTKADGEKTPHWSYFGKDGAIRTNWVYLTNADGEKMPHWSYFGPNGWLRTGWQQMGKGTSNPDGNAAKHWSYFGGNGWLRTGWVQLGKGTSEPDGNSSKHWSYFGGNGWLRTGWQWMDKSQGEKTPHWSYFGGNGWLRTGMVTLGKADGEKVTHKSYFGGNGWLVTNKTFTCSGTNYKADGKGWLTVVKKANTGTSKNSSTSQANKKQETKTHTHTWKEVYTTEEKYHKITTHEELYYEARDGKIFHDHDKLIEYTKSHGWGNWYQGYDTVIDRASWMGNLTDAEIEKIAITQTDLGTYSEKDGRNLMEPAGTVRYTYLTGYKCSCGQTKTAKKTLVKKEILLNKSDKVWGGLWKEIK